MAGGGCIGVVGAGVMGSEIAQVAAAAGLRVLLHDLDPDAVERGRAHVSGIGARRVARGRMTAAEADRIDALVVPTADADALAGCDVVIEAVTEVMAVKRSVFAAIDAVAGPDAIIASNTSGLSITELGRATGRPAKVVGLHFFNPASVMSLVEVIRGEDTSEETLAAAVRLATDLGKRPVVVRECPGFLVNRILCRALGEAYRHADESGTDPAAADAAVVANGPAPMGPFALGNLIGIDTLAHVVNDLNSAYGDRFSDRGVTASLVAQGRLGDKSGGGFVIDPACTDPTTDEGRAVAERYYLAAFDEACRCLEERICAQRDVDVAMRLGTGWSVGPLAWADAVDLADITHRLEVLSRVAGPRFAPRAVLAEHVASGTRLGEST